ncbi:MAG: hypothetical protein AB9M53_00380 [Leptothrix sp. (in: b-proteobacteria)]
MANLPLKTGAGSLLDAATTVAQQQTNLGNLLQMLIDLYGQSNDSATNKAGVIDAAMALTGTIAAAATTNLSTLPMARIITITNAAGTVAIAGFGVLPAGAEREVQFSITGGAVSLTYSPTALQIPGNQSLLLANGDSLRLISLGAGNWRVRDVIRAYGPDAAVSGIGRNRLINGNFQIDQRNNGAAQTITAGAALAYTADRWYAYSTGANVSAQRVAGTAPERYAYQFTGAAGVTAIGIGQRIEAENSADLAGSTATLSVSIADSLLTTVTWAVYYANTTDTFGTLAAPTRTLIATGTFTVSATRARYSAQIAVPAAATTGLEVVLSVAAHPSGTWRVDSVQLEAGSVATPAERRPIGTELALCQRYYEVGAISLRRGSSEAGAPQTELLRYAASKRAAPSVALGGAATFVNVTADSILSLSFSDLQYSVTPTAVGGYAVTNRSWSSTAEL